MLNWLNIELTNDCNKACHFCGRAIARSEKTMPVGYMDITLLDSILQQFTGQILQFNKDGEPLLYPQIAKVGEACSHLITNIVTNGKLLWEKRDEVKKFTTVTVSVIEDDAEQFNIVKNFIEYTDSPKVYIKFLGSYDNLEYGKLGLRALRRTIHNPEGDTNYEGSKPPIPELGICLDFLYKPAIDWEGFVHICNRFDPDSKGVLGNIKYDPLDFIWNGALRNEWLEYHKKGERKKVPLCKTCEFWGIPTNG